MSTMCVTFPALPQVEAIYIFAQCEEPPSVTTRWGTLSSPDNVRDSARCHIVPLPYVLGPRGRAAFATWGWIPQAERSTNMDRWALLVCS